MDLVTRPRQVKGYQRNAQGQHPEPHDGQNPEYATDHEDHSQYRSEAKGDMVVAPLQGGVGEARDVLTA